jgi:hypothetical protein
MTAGRWTDFSPLSARDSSVNTCFNYALAHLNIFLLSFKVIESLPPRVFVYDVMVVTVL